MSALPVDWVSIEVSDPGIAPGYWNAVISGETPDLHRRVWLDIEPERTPALDWYEARLMAESSEPSLPTLEPFEIWASLKARRDAKGYRIVGATKEYLVALESPFVRPDDTHREIVDFETANVAIGFVRGYVLTVAGTTRTPMRVVLQEAPAISEYPWWVIEVVGYHDGSGIDVMTPYAARFEFDSVPAGKRGIELRGANEIRHL
jgi:hypothetical protein